MFVKKTEDESFYSLYTKTADICINKANEGKIWREYTDRSTLFEECKINISLNVKTGCVSFKTDSDWFDDWFEGFKLPEMSCFQFFIDLHMPSDSVEILSENIIFDHV